MSAEDHIDALMNYTGKRKHKDDGSDKGEEDDEDDTSRLESTICEGDDDCDLGDAICVGDHSALCPQTGRSLEMRKDEKKVRRFLKLALGSWSFEAHRVWSEEGRRFAEWWLDVEVYDIPEEMKMLVLSFCSRQDWVKAKVSMEGGGQDGALWLRGKKEEEMERERMLMEMDGVDEEEEKGLGVVSENPYVGMYF